MPLGEIAGEVVVRILRFIGGVFVELGYEVIIKGTGYVTLRLLRPRTKPREEACAITGLLVLVGLAGGGFWLYRRLTAA